MAEYRIIEHRDFPDEDPRGGRVYYVKELRTKRFLWWTWQKWEYVTDGYGRDEGSFRWCFATADEARAMIEKWKAGGSQNAWSNKTISVPE